MTIEINNPPVSDAEIEYLAKILEPLVLAKVNEEGSENNEHK